MDTVNHLKLRLERRHAATVVRALLHAIYFHRTLDNIDPETLDVLETHAAVAGTSSGSTGRGAGTGTGGGGGGGGGGDTRELEREIAAKVDEFQAAFVDSGADLGEIAVVFLQRKNRKGWFAVTEALVPWEEHLITITFVTRATTNPLPGALLQLLSFCAEHKGNVPPLVGSSDQNNLSHQILISPPPPADLFAPLTPPSGTGAGGARVSSPPLGGAGGAAATPSGTDNGHSNRQSSTGGTAQRATLPAPRSGLPGNTGGVASQRSASPMAAAITDAGTSAMGYLEQAKDGLRKAGAVGWARAPFGTRS